MTMTWAWRLLWSISEKTRKVLARNIKLWGERSHVTIEDGLCKRLRNAAMGIVDIDVP